VSETTPPKFSVSRGRLTKPRRCLLYGPHGIGKSTCASDALVLDLEGGSSDIDLARIDLHAASYADFIDCLAYLFTVDVEQPTVAIDTIDWLDGLIEQEVCKANKVANLADIDYGKGNGKKVSYWEYILTGLDQLRERKGKNILLLAHAKLEKVSLPDVPSYQRHSPKVDNPGSAIIQEWCDEVLSYRYRVATTSENLGFNKERKLAVNTTERYIQTQETPSALAKNRLSLPLELTSFDTYKQFLSK
jgi:hypothetical protein